MTNLGKIGVVGLLVTAYQGVRLYLTSKDLIYAFGFPQNIKTNFSAWTINFDIPVTFTNTKSSSIKINSLNLNVQTKGVTVGQAFIIESFRIPANGVVTIPVASVVSIENLISVIADIISSINKPIVFNFSGNGTAANVFPFPIQAQVSVTLLARIIDIFKQFPNKKSRVITQSSARQYYSIEPNELGNL